MELTVNDIKQAIHGAIATRGNNKGKLKAACPPMHTDAAAAWQAIQSEANPFKLSLTACLFFTARQQTIFNAVRKTIRTNRIDVRSLDRDRLALENLGAW